MPMPRTIAAAAVKASNSKRFPPERSITEFVNLSPSPEAKMDPMMIPAHAQAIVTGTALRTPISSAPHRSVGLRRVWGDTKLNTNSVMLAANAASIAVKPTASNAMSTNSVSS